MAEPSLFPMTPQSSPQRPLSAMAASNADGAARYDAHDLRRRQSVRFMGPCSTQARGRGAHAYRNSKDISRDSADTQGSRDTGNQDGEKGRGLNACAPSPPKRAPPPVPFPTTATSYLDALAAAEEYYTPEDDVASAPSSYRRLHRSRSMFTDSPGVRSFHESSGRLLAGKPHKTKPLHASTSRRFFRSDPNDGKSSHEAPTLRAPRSMSFLSSRRSQARLGTSRDGSAPDYTRSGLPEVPEDGSSVTDSTPRPKHKSSTFFGSLSRHSDFRMRKSVRDSSSTEDLRGASSASQNHPERSTTLRLRARNVSRSLRIKLKGLFASARPEEETMSIPCQHVEARRTYITHIQTSDTDDRPPADEDGQFLRTPPAKVPAIHVVAGLVHSNGASMSSLKSERDRDVSAGSSLTSWAHSGPSTLTSQEQQQWREWEKQRLSVIRENGAHVPSPSIRRRVLGSGLFRPPNSASESPVLPRHVVDSQRIYSALVKRMQATNNGGERLEGLPESRRGSGSSAQTADKDAERDSGRTPATIRRVLPGRQYMDTPTRCSKKASLSHNSGSWDRDLAILHAVTPDPQQGYANRLSTGFNLDRPASVATEADRLRKETKGQSTADNESLSTQGSALPSWRSRDVGSPASHLFRTGSPYRRALRKSMQEEQNAWAQQGTESDQGSDASTQVHHTSDGSHLPETDSDSAKDLEYSESVYSSDECERGLATAPGASNRNSSLDTPAMYRAGGHREASTASSVDWKTWLSANIDKFEPAASPSKLLETELAHPRNLTTTANKIPSLRGHVREPAQIHDDNNHEYDDADNYTSEEDVFHQPNWNHTPFTTTITTTATAAAVAPLSQLQPNIVANPPPLRHALSTKRRLTTPHPQAGNGPGNANLLVENESPSRLPPPPPPPPIPPRSKLRPDPLRIWRPSGGLASPAASVLSSPGLTEAVRRQFGGVERAGVGSRIGFGFGVTSYGVDGEGVGNKGIAEVLEEGGEREGRGNGRGDESFAFI